MLIIVLTSIFIALIFAPLGCLTVWKKYINFGDGLAHASVLAGSLSVILDLQINFTGIAISIVFAGFVFKFKNSSSANATINLISALMLSVAVILGITNPTRVNISQLLFGDIISASYNDLLILGILMISVSAFIGIYYKHILLIVLNKDTAKVKKVKVDFIELLFLIFLSIAVFSSVRIVGSLLITGVLVIPAISARLLSRSPLQMIILSTIIALCANLIGLASSFYMDVPVAPIIIIIQSMIYLLCNIIKSYTRQNYIN